MDPVRRRAVFRWLALGAVTVALILLSLALTVLGPGGSAFSVALAGVAAGVAALAAVAAVLQTVGQDRRQPSAEQSAPVPPPQERPRDRGPDPQEEARRARWPDLTAEAQWECRVPDTGEYFCGRDELVQRVVTRMRAVRDAGRAPVALLAGQPGVGSSSVAWAVARRLAADFPDGVYRVGLSGLMPGQRQDTADVVEHVSRAMNLHLDDELQSDQERLARLAGGLAGKRVLLILDDAKDAEHVARLVKPPIAAGIVVTSRNRQQSYVSKGLFFDVPPLKPDPAIEMLEMFGSDRPHSRDQLERLAELCAYIPLALDMIGRKIQGGVPADLEMLIVRLKQARLDHLNDNARAVRAAIDLSYHDLDDQAPAQRAFRLLSAAPGYACTPAEMARGTDETPPDEQRLETLVWRSLARQETPYALDGNRAVSYSLYELVKDFARERLYAEEPLDAIRGFELNMVRFLRDRLREITSGPGLTAAADRLDLARYEAAEELAEARGWLDLAAELADGLHILFLDRGAGDGAATILERIVQLLRDRGRYQAASAAALNAARHLDDRAATRSAVAAATLAAGIAREHELAKDLARAEVMLSYLHGELDDWKSALAAGERAARLLRELRPRSAAIPVLINNCAAAIELARGDDALRWSIEATELADSVGSDYQRALAAFERGRAESLTGNDAAAAEFSQRAGELFEGLRNWANAGVGFSNAADRSRGHAAPAGTCALYERSVRNWSRTSGDFHRAHLLTALVDLSAALVTLADDGSLAQARETLDQAASLADELGAVVTGVMRSEVRLRDAGMRMALRQPGRAGDGPTAFDLIRETGRRTAPGEQRPVTWLAPDVRLDPAVQHVANVLRRADGGLDAEARSEIIRFLGTPARHRAESFETRLCSSPGELSA